jgi:hypothetical protein
MYPGNWLRPRVTFNAPSGQNLFELRLRTPEEPNELVVYTKNTWWTMPLDMWKRLTNSHNEQRVEVSIRGGVLNGAGLSGVAHGSKQSFVIAPIEADAGGTIVYWFTGDYAGESSEQTQSGLRGFRVGDENTAVVLTPELVKDPPGPLRCVGCHDATPDGKFTGVGLAAKFEVGIASVEKGTEGSAPDFLTSAGRAATYQPELGPATFSRAHWTPGDYVELTTKQVGDKRELIWILLDAAKAGEGNAYGTIERKGDPSSAWTATWSHDGERIVYTSVDGADTLGSVSADADLFSVPYGNRKGGDAKAITGAAESNFSEYCPNFSADDKLVIFNRFEGNGSRVMYNQKLSDIYVIPAAGGSATRAIANDAPACTEQVAPGLTNSWARFSPEAKAHNGKSYYWYVFSSKRLSEKITNPRTVVPSQLFMGAVTVDRDGKLHTFGAVHIWNQPETASNHQAAWNVFNIPKVPAPIIPPK